MLDLFKNIIRKNKDRPLSTEDTGTCSDAQSAANDAEIALLLKSNPSLAEYYTELPHRYILQDKIGEGAFSTVYRAKDTQENMVIAVKIIKKEAMKREQIEATRREIAIMRRLDHPNIIKMYSFQNMDDSKFCFIFMELVSGGELFNQIIKYTYFSEDLTRHVMRQVATTVKFLHDRGIVHRDIKPENLLFEPIEFFERPVDEQIAARRKSDDSNKVDEGRFVLGKGAGGIGRVKLADFGLSIDLGETGSTMAKTPCGTVGYTSPEQHMNIGYDKKVDVWALGCVLYTMVVGFPPFYSNTQDTHDISKKVSKGDYKFLKPWFDEVSVECKNLISNLLTVDPVKRYSIEQFLNDPWMNIGYEASCKRDTNPAADAPGAHFDAALFQRFQKSLINTENIDDYFSGNKLSTTEAAVTPRAEAIKLVFNTATNAQRSHTPLLPSASPSSGVVDTLFMSTITARQRKNMTSFSDLSELDSNDDEEDDDHHDNNVHQVSGVFSPSDLESEDSELENNDADEEDDDVDEETEHFIQSMGELKKFNSPRCHKKPTTSVNIVDSTTSSCITPVQSHATATTVTTVMTVGSASPKGAVAANTNGPLNKSSVHSKSSSVRSTHASHPHTRQHSIASSIQSSPNAIEPQDSRASSIVTCEIHDVETGSRRKSSISFHIAPKKSSISSCSSSMASIANSGGPQKEIDSFDEEEDIISTSNRKQDDRDSSDASVATDDDDYNELKHKMGKHSLDVIGLSEEGDETEQDIDLDTPKASHRLSFGAECQAPHRVFPNEIRRQVLTHTPFVPHQSTPNTGVEDDTETKLDKSFINQGVFDLKMTNSKLLSRRKNNNNLSVVS